jgi:hypothetical protein
MAGKGITKWRGLESSGLAGEITVGHGHGHDHGHDLLLPSLDWAVALCPDGRYASPKIT